MEEQQPHYSPMQAIKRRFFAMRNGVVADVLRRAGSPYRVIFGLNLPQIVDIATSTGPSRELAEDLWANSTTRESVLAAPMLMPRDTFTIDDARRWVETVPDREAADYLCHRLLRHMPYAMSLADELSLAAGMKCYTGVRLAVNLVYAHPTEAMTIAGRVLAAGYDPQVERLANQIVTEVNELGLA